MSPNSKKAKKIYNDPSTAIDDALKGVVMANRGLIQLKGHHIVMRRDHRSLVGRVKLISGGGGGHYPLHFGYVGPGMLTASITGQIFRAPPSNEILIALRELGAGHPEGVLLIISNYVGDRINFGLATERARQENIKVRMLIIADDCSVEKPAAAIGRRGIAGIVFVIKVAGAMAEEGRKLEDIYNACREPCLTGMVTMGVALRAPNMPGFSATYHVPDDTIAIGVGIHDNEPGVHDIPSTTTARMIVHTMLEHLFQNAPSMTDKSNADVAVLINNLGGSSKLEEQIFAMEALTQLASRGLRVRRVFAGKLLTSLDTNGMSITVMSLKAPFDVVKYLDADTPVPGWPRVLTASCVGTVTDDEHLLPITYAGRQFTDAELPPGVGQGPRITRRGSDDLHHIIRIVAEAVMNSSATLNKQDTKAHEGDCGTNVKKGAEEILHSLKSVEIDTRRPYAALQQMCNICERSMTGTSGALYSIFFTSAAAPFAKLEEDAVVDERLWLAALHEGVEAIKRYGMAQKGDRTMLDPMIAAETAGWAAVDRGDISCKNLCADMATAAEVASEETLTCMMRFGYTATHCAPDPGAFCVAVWMRAISEGVEMIM